MNCHGDNKEKQRSHSPLKHMLHMLICCGLPIVIIGLLPFIARINPAAGGALGKIAPYLCPVMMLAMLPMMLGGSKKGGGKASCCDTKEERPENV